MSEQVTQGFVTLTKLLVASGIFIVCACAVLFWYPMFTRLLLDIEETVDSYTMTGTTCETLKADLAFSEEIPSLSAREIQKDDGFGSDTEPTTQLVTPDVPVTSRRIAEGADLTYFYGNDVIDCFGDPTYYYTYWQQEPEDRALIAELIYPEERLIFRSYSLSDWQGNPATLHPKTRFDSLKRIPSIKDKSDLAPVLSYPWYDTKPLDPSWVNSKVHNWQGWEHIILTNP